MNSSFELSLYFFIKQPKIFSGFVIHYSNLHGQIFDCFDENNLANSKVVKEHEWNIHQDELNEQSDTIENNDALNYEEYLVKNLKMSWMYVHSS